MPHIKPSDLGEHPELALLQVLDSVLELTRLALIAAHPQLDDADPDVSPSDLQALAADHVLIAADALQRLVASYRQVLNSEALWVQVSTPDLRGMVF